jgi:hypothetical protein
MAEESTCSGLIFWTGASVTDFGKNGFLPSFGLDGMTKTDCGISVVSLVALAVLFSKAGCVSASRGIAVLNRSDKSTYLPFFEKFAIITNPFRNYLV